MNYIQYMKPGGTTENKKQTSKFIELLNKAGKSWKDFWDKPMTIQYAYNPHAVVGNSGIPFSSTLRRGDFAAQATGALAVPATAAGIAAVGVPATTIGMGVGIGVGAAGSAGGSKLIEVVGGDENAQEMVGDIAGFTLGAISGGKATKASNYYSNLIKSGLSPKSIYTAMSEAITPVKTSSSGIWTNRGTRSAKISEAERLGISKGIKYYTQEENLAFRNQINNFAKKYGYEPIGDEVTDPEVLERYARSLIKRHNTFYRGVELNPKESSLSLEYMATHAPGGGSGEIYITPYLSVAAMYGEPVEILRPYKLGSNRTKWFDEGDFQIYTAGGRRDMHLWENKKGITSPWLSSEEFEGKTSWVYKPHVETELTGRNLQFIPMSIQYRYKGRYPLSLTRVGSLAVPTTAFYKSGGSIHIKKKNKGKFAKVRDYVGYKNSK